MITNIKRFPYGDRLNDITKARKKELSHEYLVQLLGEDHAPTAIVYDLAEEVKKRQT